MNTTVALIETCVCGEANPKTGHKCPPAYVFRVLKSRLDGEPEELIGKTDLYTNLLVEDAATRAAKIVYEQYKQKWDVCYVELKPKTKEDALRLGLPEYATYEVKVSSSHVVNFTSGVRRLVD